MIVVGGLGGGGDVLGAVTLAIHLDKLMKIKPLIVSFYRCSSRDIVDGKQIADTIIEVHEDTSGSFRYFDPLIARLGYKVYTICLKNDKETVINDLRYFAKKQNISKWIAVDLGGDSLVNGDEPELASYVTDTLGIASLSILDEESLLKSYLAVGVLGLEGGGVLDKCFLARNLHRYYIKNIYLGYYEPPGEIAVQAVETLTNMLEQEVSAMATIYRDALTGFTGHKQYDILYLHKTLTIHSWHKYFFIFKIDKLCRETILCNIAKDKWIKGLKTYEKSRIIKLKTHKQYNFDKIIKLLLKKRINLNILLM